MLSIAICDDQPEHGRALHGLLNRCLPPESAVMEFRSAGALLEALEDRAFDVFFLDIELGGDSGVLLAKRINERLPDAQIVFVTANIMNAVDVGEANHTYFLTKPVEPERLRGALDRVLLQMRGRAGRRVTVRLRGGASGMLSPGEMLYCERTKRTTTIVCGSEAVLSPETLDELEEKLPPLLFARPHNSFLVNLAHVVKLGRTVVTLDNGVEISVSNQRRMAFRSALARYVAGG